MPQWKPKLEILGEQIEEEMGKIQAQEWLPERPAWQPVSEEPIIEQPMPVYTQPVKKPEVVKPEVPKVEVPEAPADVPFWARALQVFATPFQWIDDYVIKPALSIAGTTVGAIPDVEREPGEDFYDWKMRSWEAWETPGIDIKVPWQDDTLRLDFKGVLAMAPWLFIPGATGIAGKIGAAAGKAAKIGGAVGKLAKPLGVLSKAVEYSPWGMVEKTAGAAMKATARAISKATERISTKVSERLFGKIPEPVIPPEVTELTKYFKETVTPGFRLFEKAKPKLTAKQSGILQNIEKRWREGKITATQRQILEDKTLGVGSLKAEFALTAEKLAIRKAKDIAVVNARIASGELTEAGGKAVITKLTKSPAYVAVKFTKEKIDDLLAPIYKMAETNWDAKDTARALRRLLTAGELPEPRHFIQLAKVYGDDFAKAAEEFAHLPISKKDQIIDFLNIGRATMASGDVSGTGRQGLILSLMHPLKVPGWFWKEIKATFSEKLARQADDVMRADPLFAEFSKNFPVLPLRLGGELAKKAEPYMTTYAQRLPIIGKIIRMSERGFVTYINAAAFGTWKAGHGVIVALGGGGSELKLFGEFLAAATGQSRLPFTLERYAPMLNAVFFSPRLQWSTAQLPRQIGRMFLSKNPYMRKEAAKALVTFAGGGAALLGILNASGVSKVETDPRSGDFGKIKIGETRLDIWRGYLQYARFFAQILTGERKSAYGNLNKVQRSEIAWRFLQSKSSPAFGLLVDLLKGETYMGDDLFTSTNSTVRSFRERLFPLAIQDTMDAIEQSGANGLWTAVPATLGIGVLTYVNDFVRTKERIARDLGYKTWDDIDPLTQRKLQNSNTELQKAFIEFDRQVMGTAWGDWGASGRAVEDVFRENIDLATAQYRSTGDGYNFREKVADAFTARRGGYQARSADDRFVDIVQRMETQDTAEALVSLGPEQLAIRTYTEALYGDDMYDEFGDYRFDEAERRRVQLRQELGDLFDYVETYRGLKFEDLPPEYQELARAKIVMRPYWQVRDEALRIFGEPKTKWAETRLESFISRTRKRLRLSNRDINYYYEKFYVRT